MKDKLFIVLGWMVSASLLYITIFKGYCKDPLGDLIIMAISLQAFIYFSFLLIKEIFE
jgi:hypothetical protein